MTCEPEVHLSTWNMRFGFCVYLLQIARTVYSRVVLVSGECRVSGVRARELGAPNKHRGRRAACAFAGFREVVDLWNWKSVVLETWDLLLVLLVCV